ncbi:MAG: nucleoside transporter C-terminal domain-containing protein [Arenicellales bacterium]|nr:nucleoside transporter C-terminal domain-containing protein [Arenicellales bacterium]
MAVLQSTLGLLILLVLAWLFSEKRNHRPHWKTMVVGAGVQLIVAAVLLKVPAMQAVFALLNDGVVALQRATEAGSGFVFGYLGGGTLPFEETQPGASFILAFRALPLVIVISALTAVLTYWRVLPWVVKGFASVLEKTMAVGGAVGLGTAANIFVGMIEAPLFVRSYLSKLSRSEMFMLMTAGMATVAGTVLILYATFAGQVIDNAIGHLLTASIISAPAAITVAKLMVPSDAPPTSAELESDTGINSSMDAITQGTMNGLKLFLNIVAMLLVFVALVHLANALLSLFPPVAGSELTFERILGWIMAPICWLMGVPWSEAIVAGSLMGVKTVLNEFIAYLQLAALPEGSLSDRSELIMAYALCGFANFGSLGIMLGGLTTMVPERRTEIVDLGLKSIVAGTLATCCTGAVVGILS